MPNKGFKELLDGYVSNTLSEKELAEFFELAKQQVNAEALEAYLDALLDTTPVTASLNPKRAEKIFNSIINTGKEGKSGEVIESRLYPRLGKFVRRLAIAASVVAVVCLGTIFLSRSNNRSYPGTNTAAPVATDKLPSAGNKAVLTLADGSSVQLDDTRNGTLAKQGNANVVKSNGALQYNLDGTSAKETVYNLISIPSGGQYQVELQDGSRVWLNSGSSLRFPVAFTEKERQVELTGEAYFEIARNRTRPFMVKANGAEVRVLGTHFNVMAYTNEASLTTTLIEGSVKFVSGQQEKILRPGQQSQLTKDGHVKIIDGVDINKVLSWKEGRFDFDSVDIQSVGRQLERRYDVRVIYKEKIKDIFYANIPLATNLPEVLKILELTGKVHFITEGKNITIMN